MTSPVVVPLKREQLSEAAASPISLHNFRKSSLTSMFFSVTTQGSWPFPSHRDDVSSNDR